MARVQYSNPPAGINECRPFPTPTVADTRKWFRACRAVIPTIPDPTKSDWSITEETVTEGSIFWQLHNSVGERCAVVVDRTYGVLSR